MNDLKQSRIESLIEAIVNTIVGFIVTITFLPVINKILSIEMSGSQMGLSTLLFTILSVARGYVVRRVFNNFKKLKLFIKRLIIREIQ